jgi:hypothetical protein
MLVWFPNPIRQVRIGVIENPFQEADTKPETEIVFQTGTEKSVVSRVKKEVPAPVLRLVKSEKAVKQTVIAHKEEENKAPAKISEEQSSAKIRIVEALRITKLRQLAVAEAVLKVKEESEKIDGKAVYTGKKLMKFLLDFCRYISPLVGKEGFDGTIPLTLKALESQTTQYTDLEQAQKNFSTTVLEHIPLELGESGRVATWGEVREVVEGKEQESIRIQTAAVIFRKRKLIRSEAVNLVLEEEEIVPEPALTLKSLGLEGLFQKVS